MSLIYDTTVIGDSFDLTNKLEFHIHIMEKLQDYTVITQDSNVDLLLEEFIGNTITKF